MRRLTALVTMVTVAAALVLCAAGGCAKKAGDTAAAGPPAKGSGLGKGKMLSTDQKAAKQAEARAKGITPDGDQGAAKALTATPDQKATGPGPH